MPICQSSYAAVHLPQCLLSHKTQGGLSTILGKLREKHRTKGVGLSGMLVFTAVLTVCLACSAAASARYPQQVCAYRKKCCCKNRQDILLGAVAYPPEVQQPRCSTGRPGGAPGKIWPADVLGGTPPS
jgi:hypothetical protein